MAVTSSSVESPRKRRSSIHLENGMEEVRMIVVEDADPKNQASGSGDPKLPEEIKSGDRSQNGKSCHQCRQKILNFAAECKNTRKNKRCLIKLCCKCLLNRYGENVEEVALIDDWKCPKCRGICNCSLCLRKQGHNPTGILAHVARASGYTSVSALLDAKHSEFLTPIKSPQKLPASDKECVNGSSTAASEPIERDDTNSFKRKRLRKTNNAESNDHVTSSPEESNIPEEAHKMKAKMHSDYHDILPGEEPKETEITLPHGTALTNVAGVDLPTEDVGNALQFITFCCTFGEILEITKGQAEIILHDIINGPNKSGDISSLIKFQIQLLTLIMDLEEESPLTPTDGEGCWLNALTDCITQSELVPNELATLNLGTNEGYHMLESSEKLGVLVFLCDETLQTPELRMWIEQENTKFWEKKKEARGNFLAAKEKDKCMQKQLQDEDEKGIITKNGDPFSISEHEAIVSEIKAESARAQAEILEAQTLLFGYKQKPDALRTSPVFIDPNGRIYWSLKDCNELELLVQDLSGIDEGESSEKWYRFDDEEIKVINQHISSRRVKRQRRRRAAAAAAAAAATIEDENSNPEIDLNEIPESDKGCDEPKGEP